ncbi:hypothetical protein SAMN06265173_14524 [Thalassovita litoralis]|uniref:Uncharacterized protein n=1 Tax=Thalassovita litoralis TaxID=1010611 RepID=A0A521FSX5_9RHOB|nr:hypothetical protein SAMN06265173_14524 [Thalassovita litoralis]
MAPPQFAESFVVETSLLRLPTLESERALGETGRSHLQEVEDLRDWSDELE